MGYILIKGYFFVVGYSPDGDSIKFQAKNPAHWDKIITDHREIFEEKLAAEDGIITLRLQGIDALETHYSPKSAPTPKDLKGVKNPVLEKPDAGGHKQPERLGNLATEAFLQMLGVVTTEWKHWGPHTWIGKAQIQRGKKTVWVSEKHQDKIPGYIVTDDVEKNGRPIAWIFPGSSRSRDGSSITTAKLAQRVEKSANHYLLQQGLVYPYFFMTLPGRLRDKLAEAAQQSQREAAKLLADYKKRRKPIPRDLANIWLYDGSTKGVTVSSLERITDRYEIFPYLFRKILKHWYKVRLTSYWDALRAEATEMPPDDAGKVSLQGFFEGGNPYVFVVSDQDFVRLDRILDIKRNRLKLKKYPFDIVFLS